MMPPTISQQWAIAIAPLPFAIISFFSSSYVIYYLLCKDKERQKLKRLYHRLVLAMNFALLLHSVTWILDPFAVPEGTPYYFGASGTIQTCTANAFIHLTTALAVPTYYGSLILQAFMGIKHNFKEEKYQWIEKFVHIVALCLPCTISIVFAATENFNPRGTGCFVSKAPQGCEADPDVTCQRGKDIRNFEYIVGIAIAFLYFVFPPSVIISMYCWIKKTQKKVQGRRGMQRIREDARRQMMQRIAIQISVYLISYWFTCTFGIMQAIYQIFTRKILYELLIFANCVYALQGFVFAMVYFALQRLGTPTGECVPSPGPRLGSELTVQDIRSSAERKAKYGSESTDDGRERYTFNIFDGLPDEDSPWAKYIDQDDDYSDNADTL